jgi:hypothetical protein
VSRPIFEPINSITEVYGIYSELNCSVLFCFFLATQRLGIHIPAATNTNATIEELLEASFSMHSMLYIRKTANQIFLGLVLPRISCFNFGFSKNFRAPDACSSVSTSHLEVWPWLPHVNDYKVLSSATDGTGTSGWPIVPTSFCLVRLTIHVEERFQIPFFFFGATAPIWALAYLHETLCFTSVF